MLRVLYLLLILEHTQGIIYMTASRQAKAYGAKSLARVAEFSGYSVDTMSRMNKRNHSKFRALCIASVCDEIDMTAEQLRAAKQLTKGLTQ